MRVWVVCIFFSRLLFLFSVSPPLWETARYTLKYCLKGPLSPKQLTNQLYRIYSGNLMASYFKIFSFLTFTLQMHVLSSLTYINKRRHLPLPPLSPPQSDLFVYAIIPIRQIIYKTRKFLFFSLYCYKY